MLDGADIDAIDEMLYRRSPSGWRTQRLVANADQSFQGSDVLGMGFTMSPEMRKQLIERDPRNRDVCSRILVGRTSTSPRRLQPPAGSSTSSTGQRSRHRSTQIAS